MSFKSYREGSRTNWGSNSDSDALTLEQINCGALLRIADATELMAKRHTDLINQRDQYERWYKQEQAENATLRRQVNAYKGQAKRLRTTVATLRERLP